MRAGRLRHRVSLYRPTTATANEYGETVGEPEKVRSNAIDGDYWAEIAPASGGETQSGDQTQASVSHTIRLRYDPNLRPLPSWKVVYHARSFEVLSWVLVDERNREILISAREMVK